jgi:hypothetical protein
MEKLGLPAAFTFDRDFREILERLMQRAMQARQLPADTDWEATSLWLVALLDGAIARLSAQPDLELTCLQGALAQTLRRVFCIGQV